ncbi:MAG TPA: signal recognition particle-docking protein FtsY, partial [Candidatus Limnocylindrales bacterium]|nr:signal recognition particle-docking protein FtsY [Candidatus Limnocylindrales bacterium]
MSLIDQFKRGLARSKSGFVSRLDHLLGNGELNEAFYEELEEILVAGDVGIQTSLRLVEKLKEESLRLKIKDKSEVKGLLMQLITDLMEIPAELSVETSEGLRVILLVGVNGSGKTTTAAKLAHHYRLQQKNVMLVAGDTFRAAAVDQLEIWAKRADVAILKQQSGSDPSALFFDAMNAAQARQVDVLIGDTAGRLHTRYNLMEELKKIYRVINRNMPEAPHQVLLVIDATTGHNAIAQAKSFNDALPLTGFILTKLDGTARGGIV